MPQSGQLKSFKNVKMFFIVGRGRSGTSLLRSVLSTHPRLSVPPEALFIMNLYNKYSSVEWEKEKISSFYNDLWSEKCLKLWKMDEQKLKDDLLSWGNSASFSSLCKTVYFDYARDKGKENILAMGDKNPHYSLFVKHLMKIFPEAKFVYLVRDPRDNVLSYQNVNFDSSNVSTLAYRWKKYNQMILRYSKKYPNKFIFLKYEDLLSDPGSTLGKTCSFLDIDFDPAMLEFYRTKRENPEECYKNISKPIDKGNISLWKEKMKNNDTKKIDYICGKMAKSFGYEVVFLRKNPVLFLITLPGVIFGAVYTFCERILFFLPFKIRDFVLNFYRRFTYKDVRGVNF